QALAEPPGYTLQSKPKVNPRSRRGLYLREHVVTVKWNNGLAGAYLDVVAQRFAKLHERIVNGAQPRLGAGVHRLDAAGRGSQVRVGVDVFSDFAVGPIGYHRGRGSTQFVLLLQPFTTLRRGIRTGFLQQANPLVDRLACLLGQIVDDGARVSNRGMNAVQR